MRLGPADVPDLAAGATLLGSGGGGSTTVAVHLLARTLREVGPVTLTAAAELPPDAPLACVGAVGSSTVMLERLPGGIEFVAAVRALERYVGDRLTAVAPLEIGGVNGLLGVAAAAWLGLPLVDADAMGRAFPRLDQTALVGTVPTAPAALADPSGDVAVLDCRDPGALERIARAALPALGAWSAVALHHGPAAGYAASAVTGSVRRALALGRALRSVGRDPGRRRDFTAEAGADVLFRGWVVEVVRAHPGVGGTVTVRHDTDRRRTLRLEFADEYLLALDDGAVLATAPDILCVLDARTWQPITVEHVTTHQPVEVLRLPAPPQWRDPRRRRLVDLESYGLAPVTAGGAP